ncbi:hypothetical protein L3Y34_012907 [Caenorhabditis briggsae]|uniref:Uncharacterized protein n=1 Tax=Caenorhabditis briggsae TaxID=6238 RepID=A0AAE8ZQD8_CAEBR|nr:hypothetical protein L3Y34_012907 [Caenorhabditis briggsae]
MEIFIEVVNLISQFSAEEDFISKSEFPIFFLKLPFLVSHLTPYHIMIRYWNCLKNKDGQKPIGLLDVYRISMHHTATHTNGYHQTANLSGVTSSLCARKEFFTESEQFYDPCPPHV